MKIKDDEMIIKRREYIDLLLENAKLKEQASPFYKYSINEIREMLGFSKIELEEKKIPEKLYEISNIGDLTITYLNNGQLMNKINEIIEYLKSKGE